MVENYVRLLDKQLFDNLACADRAVIAECDQLYHRLSACTITSAQLGQLVARPG